jgi:uncharacterized protein YjbJ (UPF0337 family)
VNWEQIEGNLKQLNGSVIQQWGMLRGNQLDVAAGKLERLAGKIQAKYGLSRDEALKQHAIWLSSNK